MVKKFKNIFVDWLLIRHELFGQNIILEIMKRRNIMAKENAILNNEDNLNEEFTF